MLATSENVLFQGHNHLLTTGADDLTLCLSPEHHVTTQCSSDFTFPGSGHTAACNY